MLPYGRMLKQPSRKLRKEMTDAEYALWCRLRKKQVLGIQFYRQKPVGPYILDFYAPAVKLVIEVDGSQHLEDAHAQRDEVRDAILDREGLMVLRYTNCAINLSMDSVIDEITQRCMERQDAEKGKSPL